MLGKSSPLSVLSHRRMPFRVINLLLTSKVRYARTSDSPRMPMRQCRLFLYFRALRNDPPAASSLRSLVWHSRCPVDRQFLKSLDTAR
jgi:hypothetical protein